MNSDVYRSACLVAVVVLCFWGSPVMAQIGPPGQSAADNNRAGAVALRAPGNMVIAGVARLQQQTNLAQAPITITETGREISIRKQLLIDSINIIFEQVNDALSLFGNLLLLRAGRTPTIP